MQNSSKPGPTSNSLLGQVSRLVIAEQLNVLQNTGQICTKLLAAQMPPPLWTRLPMHQLAVVG